jgi:hypothetical protein
MPSGDAPKAHLPALTLSQLQDKHLATCSKISSFRRPVS